jgi:hypothetical protein
MGATLERMGGEKGIVPERSEWFRSSGIIGTTHGQGVERRGKADPGKFESERLSSYNRGTT